MTLSNILPYATSKVSINYIIKFIELLDNAHYYNTVYSYYFSSFIFNIIPSLSNDSLSIFYINYISFLYLTTSDWFFWVIVLQPIVSFKNLIYFGLIIITSFSLIFYINYYYVNNFANFNDLESVIWKYDTFRSFNTISKLKQSSVIIQLEWSIFALEKSNPIKDLLTLNW